MGFSLLPSPLVLSCGYFLNRDVIGGKTLTTEMISTYSHTKMIYFKISIQKNILKVK